MCYFLTKCCAMLSHSVVSDSAVLRTAARQAPLSMGFLRQEYWSGLPFLSPGDLPDPPVLAGGLFITKSPGKPEVFIYCLLKNAQTTAQFTHLTRW